MPWTYKWRVPNPRSADGQINPVAKARSEATKGRGAVGLSFDGGKSEGDFKHGRVRVSATTCAVGRLPTVQTALPAHDPGIQQQYGHRRPLP